MINWNMNCMKERERGLTEHGAEQVDLAGGRDGAGAPEDGAASPEQPLQRRRLRLHPPAPPGPSRRRHRHPPPLHRRRRLHPATPLLLHHAAAIAATSPPRSPPHLHQRSNQEQQQQEARSSKNQESRSNAWRRRGARSSVVGRYILALETGSGETWGSIKSMDCDVNTAAGLGWVGYANPPRRERETGFYLFLLFFFWREREREKRGGGFGAPAICGRRKAKPPSSYPNPVFHGTQIFFSILRIKSGEHFILISTTAVLSSSHYTMDFRWIYIQIYRNKICYIYLKFFILWDRGSIKLSWNWRLSRRTKMRDLLVYK